MNKQQQQQVNPQANQSMASVGQNKQASQTNIQQEEPPKVQSQVLHTVRVHVDKAEIYKDPEDLIEQRYVPPKGDEPKSIRRIEKKLETYIKIYFGTERERASTYIHKQFLRKNTRKVIKQQVSNKTNVAFNTTIKNTSMVRDQNQSSTTNQRTNDKTLDLKDEDNEPDLNEEEEEEEELPEYFNIGTTSVSEDHLKPEWKEILQFSRTTETYFTIVLYQYDTDAKYHQRYYWLKEKYEGDKPIGQAKVEFTRFVKQQRDGSMDKTVKLYDGNQEVATLDLKIEYIDAVRPEIDDRFLKLQLSFYGFVAQFDMDIDKYLKNDFKPYLFMKIRQHKKKSEEGLQSQPKQMKWSTKLDFKMEEEDAIDVKAAISVIMYNEKTKFQEVIGVSVLELNQLKVGDNRLDKALFMSYKGKFSGTMFLEYVKQPPVKKKVKKVEFRDIKEVSKPTEDDLKKKEILDLKKEQLGQKFLKFSSPQPIKIFIPDPKDLITIKERPKILLPDIPLKDGTIVEPVHREIQIKSIDDYDYRQQVHGSGLTKWGSSGLLTVSSHQFSVPREERFRQPSDIKIQLPFYGSLGLHPKQDIIDQKLAELRRKNYEDYVKTKKFSDPVGNEKFWDQSNNNKQPTQTQPSQQPNQQQQQQQSLQLQLQNQQRQQSQSQTNTKRN